MTITPINGNQKQGWRFREMEKIIIAAVSENYVIGFNGKIPWNIPEDLKRFRKLTTGHSIVMGRRTYESIPQRYKPLPERKNIVLSKRTTYRPSGVLICSDLASGLREAEIHSNKCFIIGGERVYREAIHLANRLELTIVKGEYKGDAFFPELETDKWKLVSVESHKGFSFLNYRRIENK
jgi:dihydrofolate reductase